MNIRIASGDRQYSTKRRAASAVMVSADAAPAASNATTAIANRANIPVPLC